MTPQPLLTTEEVATLLGVKPATVYAYVSRGLLASQRNGDGKNSLFTRSDIDAFRAGRKRTTTPGIQTGITLIKDGRLFFRGHDATVLARETSYESVATMLWTGPQSSDPTNTQSSAPASTQNSNSASTQKGGPPRTQNSNPTRTQGGNPAGTHSSGQASTQSSDLLFPVHAELRDLAVEVTAKLPATARLTDRLRVIVAAASAADPLRFDTTPTAVIATGRLLLATMVHSLPPRTGIPVKSIPLAEALWHRLTSVRATDDGLRALNAAMVLLADHDIAASTLAARVAASTRAHPYAVVSAGLAALDGPLHGAASGLAYRLLIESSSGPGPAATISERLRTGVPVPGFGHSLYPGGDPRATALFDLLDDGAAKRDAMRLDETMRTRSGTPANIDLALAALALEYRMPAEAGEVIFAVARTAGWLAHALEEYGDRPLRFRPSGTYAGHQPT
ncbi:citrate synthase family protein [Actinoplanes derwentensis]|uniref:citrate synthase (unknown stereospecificity) n=1 Tax=Actinoplanes derwentensis TaxID=113562 RepID=A0A1H2A764_9ACTN|nr:citrate synthase family protein [Actinoplanes derwentensis]GID88492.1 hypothetical protein Ade03nite_74160 [Actinoplanes derwentensis]SDT41632.1 citrate synthase [Actinoplanes derwentensis]